MSVDDLKSGSGAHFQQTAGHEKTEGPLVSVITAVFNGAATIRECLESVLTQDYPHIEHIVMDGGSTDGTIDVLREYQGRIALWVSEPDHGVYDAWNKGLQKARGEWIAFLGADDTFLPGAISEYMQLAKRNPSANFLTSRARLQHPLGYSPEFGDLWSWPRAARSMPSVHVGAMHRRSVFARHGQFDSSYRIAGDYEFLLRAREDLHAAFTPAVTVLMRAGGLSDSTAGLVEAKRAKLQHKIRSAPFAEVEFRALALRFHLRRRLIKAASGLRLFRDLGTGTRT
jgi:glycosyltransferase involved in cell wall biosynthesis